MQTTIAACDEHLRRTWLLGRLDPHLDRQRARISDLLGLTDEDLIAAVGGSGRVEVQRDWRAWNSGAALVAREEAARRGLTVICECDRRYPAALRDLDAPPAALHVAGDAARFQALCDQRPVAIVGSRRPSEYGASVAGSLGRSLAGAGTPVISGMAGGIDSHAHRGALEGGGATIAVLPGSADRPYPAAGRALHARIIGAGAVVSERAPGASTRRWTFTARNRIIAALSDLTIVVEARERSGSLVTAAFAEVLGRRLGAVPGMVTNPAAAGANRLLADGASVILSAQDALDAVYGVGVRGATVEQRPPLTECQARIVDAIAAGSDTPPALARSGISEMTCLVELAALEMAGWLRRGAGGRFSVIA